MTAPRRWLKISEIAAMYGLKPKSCYLMAARGILPSVHLGRLIRIDGKVLETDLERQIAGRDKGSS